MIPQFKVKIALDAKEIVAKFLILIYWSRSKSRRVWRYFKRTCSSVRPVTSQFLYQCYWLGIGFGLSILVMKRLQLHKPVLPLRWEHAGSNYSLGRHWPITLNDPNSIERLITDKTKAIIAVNCWRYWFRILKSLVFLWLKMYTLLGCF